MRLRVTDAELGTRNLGCARGKRAVPKRERIGTSLPSGRQRASISTELGYDPADGIDDQGQRGTDHVRSRTSAGLMLLLAVVLAHPFASLAADPDRDTCVSNARSMISAMARGDAETATANFNSAMKHALS